MINEMDQFVHWWPDLTVHLFYGITACTVCVHVLQSNPNFLQLQHNVDHLRDGVNDNPAFWWLDHQRMKLLRVEMAGRQRARPIIARPPQWSYLCVHLLCTALWDYTKSYSAQRTAAKISRSEPITTKHQYKRRLFSPTKPKVDKGELRFRDNNDNAHLIRCHNEYQSWNKKTNKKSTSALSEVKSRA